MNMTVSHGLPPRLGHAQLEAFSRHAAPCSFYLVHPRNEERIPCFISGYRVCVLDGTEGEGVVIFKPGSDQIFLQRTEAASGVTNTKPCFVPIDAMHRDVQLDAQSCESPRFTRVKVLGVVDEYGVSMRSASAGEGFPAPGMEAYLFPHGIRHFSSERGNHEVPSQGVRVTGLHKGQSAVVAPLMDRREEVRGIPVLCPRSGEPIAVAWI